VFESIDTAPPDPIFGLIEAYRRDPDPAKINLCAGVYQDEDGRTPVFAAVKEAEQRIYDKERSKAYLPIEGEAEYGAAVEHLVLGEGSAVLRDRRAATAQTPGGTGALRVFGDLWKSLGERGTVWTTDPTWPNHPQIFAAVGLPFKLFPYFDAERNALAFERLMDTLEEEVQPGDVVLLHGCCHNPSGVDPSAGQWSQIADTLARRRILPLIDIAYQGFAHGIEEDALNVRTLCSKVPEIVICSSFSKNFGLYRERVGAVSVVAESAGSTPAILSHLKQTIRANYSNPPAHGAAIAATILADPELRRTWEEELSRMRKRIRSARRLLAAGLDDRGVALSPEGNGFIVEQNGMFSFTPLNPRQVVALRDRFSLYILDSGRINVAGITQTNVDRICDAVAAVVETS